MKLLYKLFLFCFFIINSKTNGRRTKLQCSIPGLDGIRHYSSDECCDEKLAKIIRKQFNKKTNRTLEDALMTSQKQAQDFYGLSFEAISSKDQFVATSYYNGSSYCKTKIGNTSILIYETPQQYNVTDEQSERVFHFLTSEAGLVPDNIIETTLMAPPIDMDVDSSGLQNNLIDRKGRQINGSMPEGTHCDHEDRTGNKCCNQLLHKEMTKALREAGMDRLGRTSYMLKKQAQRVLEVAVEVFISPADFALSSYHIGDNICKFEVNGHNVMVYETPIQRLYNIHNLAQEGYFDSFDNRDPLGTRDFYISEIRQEEAVDVVQNQAIPAGGGGGTVINETIHRIVQEQKSRPDYNKEDRRTLTTAIRNAVEDATGRIMETIISSSDFVLLTYSPGPFSKLRVGDHYIMAYATPISSNSPPYPFHSAEYNDIGHQSKVQCYPMNVTLIEGFAGCDGKLHYELLKGADMNAGKPERELSRDVIHYIQWVFQRRYEILTARSDFVWANDGSGRPYVKISAHGLHILTFQSSGAGDGPPNPYEFFYTDIVRVPYPMVQSLQIAPVTPPPDLLTALLRYNCFSWDTWIITPRGRKRIDKISVGDYVLTGGEGSQAIFSPITMWIHKENETLAEFLKITTANGRELRITPKHYIMKTNCNAPFSTLPGLDNSIYAEELQIDDCLYVNEIGQWRLERIQNITSITSKGIYAPLTANGKILVNGILASCYANRRNSQLQNTYLEFAFWIGLLFEWIEGKVTSSLPLGIYLMDSIYDIVIPQRSMSIF